MRPSPRPSPFSACPPSSRAQPVRHRPQDHRTSMTPQLGLSGKQPGRPRRHLLHLPLRPQQGPGLQGLREQDRRLLWDDQEHRERRGGPGWFEGLQLRGRDQGHPLTDFYVAYSNYPATTSFDELEETLSAAGLTTSTPSWPCSLRCSSRPTPRPGPTGPLQPIGLRYEYSNQETSPSNRRPAPWSN